MREKSLVRKKIDTSTLHDDDFVLCSVMGTILVYVVVIMIMACIFLNDNRIEIRKNHGAGYYCEYCHQGIRTKDGYYRDLYDKEYTIAILRHQKCNSESGKHKVKWFKYNPNKIQENKKLYIK